MTCPICSKTVSTAFTNHPSYIRNRFYDIFFCINCNASFVNPGAPGPEIYNELYDKGSEQGGYGRYHQYCHSIVSKTAPLKYLASQEDTYFFVSCCLAELKHPTTTVLEIGCGLGYLTYALNREGFSATGIDLSRSAITAATEAFGDYFRVSDGTEYAKKTKNRYDFIIATEVIEHIPDVKSFLLNLKAILEPGGKILLTTPNKSAFDSTALWVTDAPPVHLWWFSEESILVLAKSIGMRVEFFNISDYNRGSYYYWRNTQDLGRPVFIPRFLEDGAIVPMKRPQMFNQLQVNASRLGTKAVKSMLLAFGLRSVIRDIVSLKMKMFGVKRSAKPYKLFAQLSRID